jgi:hypothetical protein
MYGASVATFPDPALVFAAAALDNLESAFDNIDRAGGEDGCFILLGE